MEFYVCFLVKTFSRVVHRSQLLHRLLRPASTSKLVMSSAIVDLLLADNVHVASRGDGNIHDETVKMTLAIPGSTLRKTLGLSRLDHDYYLKIPILGVHGATSSGFSGIAQLTPATAGQLFSSFFQQTDKEASASEVPKPVGVLPWDTRS